MTKIWIDTVLPVTFIYLVRIMGVFLFTPIFSASMQDIPHATPFLIGITIGIFGLVQAAFQIPFGLWSDKYGRKKLITLGLWSYIVGSILGIMAESIYSLIIARAIQGLGAISAVLSALMVDLLPESIRIRAFAFIGVMIAVMFMLCMVISPVLVQHYGLKSLFAIIVILSLAGLLISYYVIPDPGNTLIASINQGSIKDLLKNKKLSFLNHSILLQHVLVCSTFYVIPIHLNQLVKVGELSNLLYFYLPSLVLSFILLVPLIVLSEKFKIVKGLVLLCLFIYSFLQLSLCFHPGILALIFLFTLYFTVFNFLEANFYAFISKWSPPANRGTALGIFATYQFLGFFLGGLFAGILAQFLSLDSVFIFNAVLSALWFFYSLKRLKGIE